MLWTAEGITILALVLFIVLYRRLVRPYRILLDGIGLLHEQDFSSRLRPVANREANQLIEVFNRMITELKNERLQVREKNRFLDLLIQASPQGVIILDFDDNINYGSEELLSRIKIVRPRLHLFGHIHARQGTKIQFGTIFSNGAIMNADYSDLRKPNLIDL